MCMLPPSGRKVLERNLIFMTDTFSFYCQSAGTKIHSWLESLSLLHVSSDDIIHQIKNRGLRQHSHPTLFFRGWYSGPSLPRCVSFLHLSSSYKKSTPEFKNISPLISQRIRKEKNTHLFKYLTCRQSNLSNGRFIFVFRTLKLCSDILKYSF